ncbi:hypothetical protein ACFL59_10755 [Planctomycetota bacterium]
MFLPPKELFEEFVLRAREDAARMTDVVLAWEEGRLSEEEKNAVLRTADMLEGDSGLMGFLSLSRLARALGRTLAKANGAATGLSRERADLILQALDTLCLLVESGTENGSGDDAIPVAVRERAAAQEAQLIALVL